MEVLEGFRQQLTGLFLANGTFAQHGHQRAGTLARLSVRDPRKTAGGRVDCIHSSSFKPKRTSRTGPQAQSGAG